MLVHVLGRKIMLFFTCHGGSCFLLHVTLVHVFPCHGVSCFSQVMLVHAFLHVMVSHVFSCNGGSHFSLKSSGPPKNLFITV